MKLKHTAASEANVNNNRGSITAIIIIGIMAFLVIGVGVGLGFLSATIQSAPNLRGDIRPAASAQAGTSQVVAAAPATIAASPAPTATP